MVLEFLENCWSSVYVKRSENLDSSASKDGGVIIIIIIKDNNKHRAAKSRQAVLSHAGGYC